MTKHTLSILIPTHNEEGNIINCIKKIPEFDFKTEIIIIDDGTDNTAALATEFAKNKENIVVLHFNRKLGQGGAILEGLKIAKCDIIITLDADYTVDPLEIPKIILPIIKYNADFVNTSRLVFPMENGAMSFTHKIGNKIFALIISTILLKRFTDVFCGTKAFKRQLLLNKLTEKEWPALDMLFTARKNNLLIAEIPVHYKARQFGNSKVKTLKTGYFHLKETIAKSINYYFL